MAPAYREYGPPHALAPLVACVWESEADDDRTHVVVPDGCVDLIGLGAQQLVVAGADTGPRYAQLRAGARLSGIRLRPGAAGAVLGLPAAEVCDQDVPLRDVWGDLASLEAVGYAPKTLARVARLRRLIAHSDPHLATRALGAGYASQAHMNEEVRRLTGSTPVRFLKDATLTAA